MLYFYYEQEKYVLYDDVSINPYKREIMAQSKSENVEASIIILPITMERKKNNTTTFAKGRIIT